MENDESGNHNMGLAGTKDRMTRRHMLQKISSIAALEDEGSMQKIQSPLMFTNFEYQGGKYSIEKGVPYICTISGNRYPISDVTMSKEVMDFYKDNVKGE
ncbi:MAG: hypothetical protein KJ906_04345 [Nanoarchaeota archaeon]|nr:hypothetical protein [Nanoarchaeota archaeon]